MKQWLVAATDGIWRVWPGGPRGEEEMAERVLDRSCVALAADGDGTVIAASGNTLYVSRKAGSEWETAWRAPRDFSLMSVAVSRADGAWYAGTEPSHVFRSRDGGTSWEELAGLRDVPSRSRWSFPPRPWTHHVSAIAPHPRDPAVLTAGIELGGLMRTEDGGRAFADHAPGAHMDCHVLCVHPEAPERVYLGAGEGTAESHDGGRTYTVTNSGLLHHYTTALAVDARDPDLCWCATCPSALRAWHSDDATARLYRRNAADRPWEPLNGTAGGLPDHFDEPVVSLAADPERGESVTGLLYSGMLARSEDGGRRWRISDTLRTARGRMGYGSTRRGTRDLPRAYALLALLT